MLEMLYTLLDACDEQDMDYMVVRGDLRITLHDFDGFDSDWSEMEHEYVDYEAVEAVEEFLYDHCDDYESEACSVYFSFGDTVVHYTWTSADI
jgi:hypothetical protein